MATPAPAHHGHATSPGPAQSRLQIERELLRVARELPYGTDLLITAFTTALQHYRRSTICTPFPTELFPAADAKQLKDFSAANARLASVPRIPDWLTSISPTHSPLGALPAETVLLLNWLLLHPSRARRTRFALLPSPHDLGQELVSRWRSNPAHTAASDGGGARQTLQLPVFATHNVPAYVLRCAEGTSEAPFTRPILAYHGTHLENLHSILHCGLQNVSGTKLQRNGAIFGAGIYMSTSYDVAFTFAEPAPNGWGTHSMLGNRLRCLLVCEVDGDKYAGEAGSSAAASATDGGSGAGASSSQGRDGESLPEKYLLVQRADAIRLLYVCVLVDRPPVRRVNWCTALIGLYVAFLAFKALCSMFLSPRHYY